MKYTIPVLILAAGCSAPVEEIKVNDAERVSAASEVVANTGDWPWWRGPNLDGHAEGEAPPTTWSESENVIWSADVPGKGHATPSIAGDQVFVATADKAADTMSLLCFNRNDGQRQWECVLHEGGFMHTHQKNSHASATPACDGKQAYAVFIANDALMVSAVSRDGEIVWQKEAGPFHSMHGYGSSPVLYRSLVIVNGDNNGSGYVAALDRATGDVVWRTARGSRASFATPVIANAAGKTQLLLSGQKKIVSYNPDSGKMLWQCKGPASTCANTMAWQGDLVFASGGYPEHSIMAIRADGSGNVLWEKRQKVYVPSLLIDQGRLFAIQDNGVAYCFDANSGDELWKKRLGGDFSASPVAAGGNIFVPNESGRMFVFKSAARFEMVAENELASGGFASPVICGGKLYVRTAHKLFCVAKPDAEKS